MRIGIFICCIAFRLYSIGQDTIQVFQPTGDNPWVETGREIDPWVFNEDPTDPWIYHKKGEPPWKVIKSEINPWLGYSGYEEPVDDLPALSADSMQVLQVLNDEHQSSVDVSSLDETESDSTLAFQEPVWPSYNESMLLGRQEYKATGAYINGFFWCGMLNILALPVAILPSFIPTTKQNMMVQDFKKAYPGISPGAVQSYNKGIRKKRVAAAWGGAATGVLVNLLIISSSF
jgi:hypothetical protein